jgi:hypothetical protein
MKTYNLSKTRNERTSVTSGTLDELIEHFGYTLECGNSWNKNIKRFPKTIEELEIAINQSYQETTSGTFVSIV